jgi:hypothetical protein
VNVEEPCGKIPWLRKNPADVCSAKYLILRLPSMLPKKFIVNGLIASENVISLADSFRAKLLVELGPVIIGLLDIPGDILQPVLLHVFVVVKIQLVIYDFPGLRIAGN